MLQLQNQLWFLIELGLRKDHVWEDWWNFTLIYSFSWDIISWWFLLFRYLICPEIYRFLSWMLLSWKDKNKTLPNSNCWDRVHVLILSLASCQVCRLIVIGFHHLIGIVSIKRCDFVGVGMSYWRNCVTVGFAVLWGFLCSGHHPVSQLISFYLQDLVVSAPAPQLPLRRCALCHGDNRLNFRKCNRSP